MLGRLQNRLNKLSVSGTQHWSLSSFFIPIIVESFGDLGPKAYMFLDDLGRHLISVTVDPLLIAEKIFLFSHPKF